MVLFAEPSTRQRRSSGFFHFGHEVKCVDKRPTMRYESEKNVKNMSDDDVEPSLKSKKKRAAGDDDGSAAASEDPADLRRARIAYGDPPEEDGPESDLEVEEIDLRKTRNRSQRPKVK